MTIKDEYGGTLAGASVLVIDDEPGMRNFLTKILEPRVKRVEQAASPDEATERLDEAHFDLVILDKKNAGTAVHGQIGQLRRTVGGVDTPGHSADTRRTQIDVQPFPAIF